MANRRVLIRRRKATQNIRKITRTMQNIATAKFQAAHKRVLATQPFTAKLRRLVADLAGAAGGLDHPLMEPHEDVSRFGLVMISSNRGLCGGYNANVLRVAAAKYEDELQEGREADVYMIGKKGINYLNFRGIPMVGRNTDIGDRPRFEQIEPIANELMARFERGELAAVHVAYMKFESSSRQRPVVMQLLPLAPEEAEEVGTAPDYEFSPEPQEILGKLLPMSVRVQLYQAFMDAAVSEQVARMVAMKAATDSAEEMIKTLTRQYNRARQTQITMELLDIVGGANALE